MAATPFEPNFKMETHRNLVLVAIPVFSWSRNPIKQVKITLGIIVYAAILNGRHDIQTENCFFLYIGIGNSCTSFWCVFLCFLGQ